MTFSGRFTIKVAAGVLLAATALGADDASLRVEMLRQMAETGREGGRYVPEIRRAAASADLVLRIEAALALYAVTGNAKEPLLLLSECLESPDAAVKRRAAVALAAIGRSGVDALVELVGDPLLRSVALRGLAQAAPRILEETPGLPALVDRELRRAPRLSPEADQCLAVAARARPIARKCAAAAAERLRAGEFTARVVAVLGLLGSDAAPYLDDLTSFIRTELANEDSTDARSPAAAVQACAAQGRAGTDRVIVLLGEQTRSEPAHVLLDGLALAPVEVQVPTLIRASRSSNGLARRWAAAGLEGAKGMLPEAFARLLELVDDKDAPVRKAAAYSLRAVAEKLPAPERLGEVVRATTHDEAHVREGATWALAAFARQGAVAAGDPLVRRLHDPEGRVRMAAVRGLEWLGAAAPSEAVELLVKMASAGKIVLFCAAALAAIAPSDERSVEFMTELLKNPGRRERVAACRGLARAGEDGAPATQRLRELGGAQNADERLWASYALWRIHGEFYELFSDLRVALRAWSALDRPDRRAVVEVLRALGRDARLLLPDLDATVARTKSRALIETRAGIGRS